MSTTASDLLQRARLTLAELEQTRQPVSRQQWESFDQSVYRLLHELISARVGWPPSDANAAALHRTLRGYPQPLQPVGDQPDYTTREAARFLGISEAAARKSIWAGTLLAAHTDAGYRVPRSELTINGPVHPALSDDEHPLARLACTVGALGDVLALNRRNPAVPELQAASAATIARGCLEVARAAATRTMSLCDPTVAGRPLDIARFATVELERMSAGAPLQGMQNPATPAPDREPLSEADELDIAIHQWAEAAREELRSGVPSVGVLREINMQGIHLYAALDTVLATSMQATVTPDVRRRLCQSALTLQAAADAWSQTTTGSSPSRDYVAASRRLYSSLAVITTQSRQASLDADTVYQALLRGASVVASLTPSATPWAACLIESGALFVHARHATAKARRLGATISGRVVTADIVDVPSLPSAVRDAQRATASVARTLPPVFSAVAQERHAMSAPQL